MEEKIVIPIRWCQSVYPITVNLVNDIGLISPCLARKIIETTYKRIVFISIITSSVFLFSLGMMIGGAIFNIAPLALVGVILSVTTLAFGFFYYKCGYQNSTQNNLPKLYGIIAGKRFTSPNPPRTWWQNGKIDCGLLFNFNNIVIQTDLLKETSYLSPQLADRMITAAKSTHKWEIGVTIGLGIIIDSICTHVFIKKSMELNDPPATDQPNQNWNGPQISRARKAALVALLSSTIITISSLAFDILFVTRPFHKVHLPKLEAIKNGLPLPRPD